MIINKSDNSALLQISGAKSFAVSLLVHGLVITLLATRGDSIPSADKLHGQRSSQRIEVIFHSDSQNLHSKTNINEKKVSSSKNTLPKNSQPFSNINISSLSPDKESKTLQSTQELNMSLKNDVDHLQTLPISRKIHIDKLNELKPVLPNPKKTNSLKTLEAVSKTDIHEKTLLVNKETFEGNSQNRKNDVDHLQTLPISRKIHIDKLNELKPVLPNPKKTNSLKTLEAVSKTDIHEKTLLVNKETFEGNSQNIESKSKLPLNINFLDFQHNELEKPIILPETDEKSSHVSAHNDQQETLSDNIITKSSIAELPKKSNAQLLKQWGIVVRKQLATVSDLIDQPGKIRVGIELYPDGELKQVKIIKSSGDKKYDTQVINSIKHLGKFPNAPISNLSDTVIFPITITRRL